MRTFVESGETMNRILLGALLLMGAGVLAAQDQPQQKSQEKMQLEKPQAKPPEKPQEKGKTRVVEEIVARVNNEIVTLTDVQREKTNAPDDARQDCQACTPAELDAAIKDKEQNVLRDLIDQSLLVQKGKDLNINVEPDVIKQMDRIRQQNKLKDMDEFEDALRKAGIVIEDYKSQIRNRILTQEVIRKEVGSRLNVPRDEIQKYYEEHKKEFVRPEMVYLAEFFLSTENKKEDEIPKIEQKAKAYLERLRKGEDFEEFAKRYSDGTTAKEGGSLGGFERGQLSKEIEDAVFKMKKGEMTDVIRTKTGFLVLRVDQRFEAGEQPLDKVEPEIQNRLYYQRMQPELRKYLTHLREESYVVVKPGYVDSAGVDSTPIVEVEPSADSGKGGKKTSKKSKAKGASADAGKKAGQ
jgi:peptidyl-prolyl cis-trans isomerase SurA